MESIKNADTKDLKDLRLYKNLRDDPLFNGLLSLCKNDKMFFTRKITQIPELKDESTFFLHFRLQFLFLFFAVAYDYVFHWDFSGICIPFFGTELNLIPTIFLLVYILSVIVCLIDMVICRKYILVGIINIIVLCGTYYVIKKMSFPLYKTFILSLVFQVLITAVLCFVLYRSYKKTYKGYNKINEDLRNDSIQYEEFYKKILQETENRVRICSEEITERGENANELQQRHFWWESSQNMLSLTSGTNFDKVHLGRYEYIEEKEHDYYDHIEEERVQGKTVREEIEYYEKIYNMFPVSGADKYDVITRLKTSEFKPVYRFNFNDLSLRDCTIYAVECICRVDTDFSEVTENSVMSSPSQSQIATARDAINEKYDNRERFHNILDNGHSYTTNEMIDTFGLTQKRFEDSAISEYLRDTELNDFVNKNSSIDKKTYARNHKSQKESSAVIMYIVDNCLFYHPRKEDKLWPEEKFTYSQMNDYYETREDEVEAAISYFMQNNPCFAKNIIEKMWNGDTELSSKIMHTIADCSSILNCME